MTPLRFAQLSDLHLYAQKDFIYHEHNTYQSFCQVIELLKKEIASLDFLLITGDMAAQQEKEVYFHIDQLLKPLTIPYYWLPGNHDSATLMQTIASKLSVQNTCIFEIKDTRFILLNSVDREEKAVEGFLPQEELTFLHTSLQEAIHTPTIIALHHQTLNTPGSWTEGLGLTNTKEFYEVIDAFTQIKAVICGHIHHAHQWERNNVSYFSAPATSYQFNPYTPTFALDDLNPGYQVFTIENNVLHHEVKRLTI